MLFWQGIVGVFALLAGDDALYAFNGQEVAPGERVRPFSGEVFLVNPLVARLELAACGGLFAPFLFGAFYAGNIEEFSVGILLNLLKEFLGQMLCCIFVSHGCSFFLLGEQQSGGNTVKFISILRGRFAH